MNNLARNNTAIAIGEEYGFEASKVQLIKSIVAVGATDDELALFLYTAQRTGLDPLAKQIYCIKRQGKMTIQAGIDGYRLIADRTGKYAGNDDPVFGPDHQVGNTTAPTSATVTVWKMVAGVRCPFTSTARWSEYCPGGNQAFMWQKMPYLMLGKCAEALALRKAFPAELSGIYTDAEMDQAGQEQPRIVDVSPPQQDDERYPRERIQIRKIDEPAAPSIAERRAKTINAIKNLWSKEEASGGDLTVQQAERDLGDLSEYTNEGLGRLYRTVKARVDALPVQQHELAAV